MNKQWTKQIGILLLVIIVVYSVVWFTIWVPFDTPLSSIEFPISEKWTTKLKRDIEQITIVDNEVIVARTMTEVYALDIHSGGVIWQQNIAWHFSYQPVLAENGILFMTDGKGALALNQSDGKILWQQALRHPSGSEIVDVTQNLVAVNDPPFLIVYEADNGAFQWEKVVCREPVQAYFFETNIVLPCYGLTAVDSLTGETVWEIRADDEDDRIWRSAFADGVMYFSQDLENITAYDVENRKLLWKTPLAEDYDSYQSYKVVGNNLLVTIDDQLCILNRDDGSNAWCTGDLIKPNNSTILENVLYLFNGLRNGITAYDVLDGSQLGRLDFPTYRFISFENDKQLMTTSNEYLIFAVGNQIYAYGK